MHVMAYFLIIYVNGEAIEAYSVRNQHTEVQLVIDMTDLNDDARNFVDSRAGWKVIYNGNDGKNYFTVIAEAGDLVRSEGNLQISYEHRTVTID